MDPSAFLAPVAGVVQGHTHSRKTDVMEEGSEADDAPVFSKAFLKACGRYILRQHVLLSIFFAKDVVYSRALRAHNLLSSLSISFILAVFFVNPNWDECFDCNFSDCDECLKWIRCSWCLSPTNGRCYDTFNAQFYFPDGVGPFYCDSRISFTDRCTAPQLPLPNNPNKKCRDAADKDYADAVQGFVIVAGAVTAIVTTLMRMVTSMSCLADRPSPGSSCEWFRKFLIGLFLLGDSFMIAGGVVMLRVRDHALPPVLLAMALAKLTSWAYAIISDGIAFCVLRWNRKRRNGSRSSSLLNDSTEQPSTKR